MGTGPRGARVGRYVRYRRADVEAWFERQVEEERAAGAQVVSETPAAGTGSPQIRRPADPRQCYLSAVTAGAPGVLGRGEAGPGVGPTSGLTDREFRVLLVLADRLNKRTGRLDPAARRIARDVGLEPTRSAVRSIRRTLAELEAQGWLQRVGSDKGGQGPGRRHPSQSYRLRDDLRSPQPKEAGVTDMTNRGDTDDTSRGDLMSSEPRKLEPGKKNLPSGSTTRLASPSNSDASAPTPSAKGRISDDLLARVRELDPEAERHTRHDGSQWIELSDGSPLPNAQRALSSAATRPRRAGRPLVSRTPTGS